jgi:DNA-binding MarR family transcriptional regulator
VTRRSWKPLGQQARVLVTNLDTLFRRLLFARIPNDPEIELARRDYVALDLIGSEGPLTMTDFASRLDVPVSTATHAVARLSRKGFVDRERSEPDRRIVRVTATEAGHELLATHAEFRRAMARDMLRPLSPDERDIFLNLIAKMSRLAVLNGPETK